MTDRTHYDHLAITVGLERVPPADRGKGGKEKAFAVLLSASYVGDATKATESFLLKYLQPWTWSVDEFKGWSWNGTAWSAVSIARSAIVEVPAAAVGSLRANVKRRIEDERTLWHWAPAGTNPDPPADHVGVQDLLASLGSEAMPIPRQLGLSYLIWTDALADTDVLVVAPTFLGGNGSAWANARVPTNAPSNPGAGAEETTLATFDYSQQGDDLKLVGYVYPRAAKVDAAANQGYLDLATGWVREAPADGGAHASWSDRDWTQRIEPVLSELSDLAAGLVEIARKDYRDWLHREVKPVPGLIGLLRKAVVGLARDGAGLGLGSAVDENGRRVIDPRSWFAAVMTATTRRDPSFTTSSKLLGELIAWEQERFGGDKGLENWRHLLLAQVSELATVAALQDEKLKRDENGNPVKDKDGKPVELDPVVEAYPWPRELGELATVVSVLQDPEVLARVVSRQWSEALIASKVVTAAQREAIMAAFEESRRFLPIRDLLARTRAGILVDGAMAAAGASADWKNELFARVSGTLVQGYAERAKKGSLALPKIPALGDVAPQPAQVRARVERALTDLLADDANDENGPGGPTPAAHAITVQVSRPGALDRDQNAPKPEADLDSQRRVHGYGLLMRRLDAAGKNGVWRCLNLASLEPTGSNDALTAAAVIPVRLGYRDGIKEVSLTYDNHPLAAPSPANELNDFGDERYELTDEFRAKVDTTPTIVNREAIRHETYRLGKLPALRFGETYELAPFAVGAGGVLPKFIAGPDDPTTLKSEYLEDAFTNRPTESMVRTLRYLRRVPVGAPRVVRASSPGVKTRSAAVPSIPSSCAPLTRELKVRTLAGGERARLLRSLTGEAISKLDGGAFSIGVQDLTLSTGSGSFVELLLTDEAGNPVGTAKVERKGTGELSIQGPDGPPQELGTDVARLFAELSRPFKGEASQVGWSFTGYDKNGKKVRSVDLPWPNFPVVTLGALDLYCSSTSTVTFGAVHSFPTTGDAAPQRSDEPLVLMVPRIWNVRSSELPTHDLTWEIARPAIDLLTWDRWAGEDVQKVKVDERAKQWARVFAAGHLGKRQSEAPIEDPAVAGLLVSAIQIHPTADRGRTFRASPTLNAGARFSLQFLHDPEVSTGRLDSVGSLVQLRAAPGEVWEIRVSAYLLAAKSNADRFHPERLKEMPLVVLSDMTSVHLAPPLRLRVEAAVDPAWKSQVAAPAEALHQSICCLDVAGRVEVRLDQGTQSARSLLDSSSRVETARQVWRWDGRQHEAFPFEEAIEDSNGVPSPTLLDWEATAFAERADTEHGHRATTIQLPAPDRDDLLRPDPLICEEQRRGDPRATLYRFGVTLFSRYRGLVPVADERLMAAAVLPQSKRVTTAAPVRVSTPWRRHLAAAAAQSPVPRPKLHLVVPLTESRTDAPSGGLLAIVDEPWYEVAGLAERLDIELASVVDPWLEDPKPTGSSKNVIRPEIGPDPLLTGSGWHPRSEPKDSNDANDPRVSLHPSFASVEPMGHTYDTDTRSPLFVTSSFPIEPPSVPEWAREVLGKAGLAWHFAKVRFRRQIVPEGIRDYGIRYLMKRHDPAATERKEHYKAFLAKAVELPVGGCWRLDMASLDASVMNPTSVTLSYTDDHGAEGRLLALDRISSGYQLIVRHPTATSEPSPIPLDHSNPLLAVRLVVRRLAGLDFQLVLSVRAGGKEPAVWRTVAQLEVPNKNLATSTLSVIASDQPLSYTTREDKLNPDHPVEILESAATDPTWVQFLPDARTYQVRVEGVADWVTARIKSDGPSGLELRIIGEGNNATLELHSTAALGDLGGGQVLAIRPLREGEDKNFLQHQELLIVTRWITDIRWRMDERYVGTYRLENGVLHQLHPGVDSDGSGEIAISKDWRLRARIVEVQHRGEIPKTALLDDLFPHDEPDLSETPDGRRGAGDAKRRIVRVSPPIDERG